MQHTMPAHHALARKARSLTIAHIPRAGGPRRAEAELLRILNDVAEGLHMYLSPPT